MVSILSLHEQMFVWCSCYSVEDFCMFAAFNNCVKLLDDD